MGKIGWFLIQLGSREYGSLIRADFAERGWSIQKQLGNELRFGDAVALFENLLRRTDTYCGAYANGLRFPMSQTAFIQYSQHKETAKLILRQPERKDDAPSNVVSVEERQEAESHMSRLFDLG